MKELKKLENKKNDEVRIIGINNKIYFVGKDVAEILGYKETRKAIERHINKNDRIKYPVKDSLGRKQESWIINENGLCSLMLSRKTRDAEIFKKWIISDALPAIQKAGLCLTDDTYKLLMKDPVKFGEMLINYEKTKKQLDEQKYKVDFYNDVTESTLAADIGTVSKLLNFKGVGRNILFEILRKKGILQQNNIPYQRYIDNGYFRVIESKWNDCVSGDIKISFKTVVYQKGIEFISKLLKELGYIKQEVQ